ncbi:hypothetical protein [Roseomonas marmotae]|uniref:Uncharacterized protein n=1 Tax=Roseomonas marmotae TaxID=2768161 RepID=A0ABS3K949_9PROT|nr:hypothetical protein [Roseomonas marmotae]MBO1073988.1 hypothetical protein [Roseomonas marmotae]QTI78779.1 hypothetical protein IAI58_14120 [Roseomonas marmotae]
MADAAHGALLSLDAMTEVPIPRRIAPESGPHHWSAEALSPADWMLPMGAEAAAEAMAAPEAPRPRLDPLLSRVAERLSHGQGFALLRGLPAPENPAALLAQLGRGMGEPAPPAAAGGGAFLTEPCDMLLLLSPHPVTMVLRSAAAVHNALLKADRGALEVLYRPLPHGEDLDLPVFAVSRGVFSARLDRAAIARGTPPEALAALDRVLEMPGLALTLSLRPGDVLCVNPFLVWASQVPGLVMQPLRAREDSRLVEGAFAGLRS